jgi:hypothetical protein
VSIRPSNVTTVATFPRHGHVILDVVRDGRIVVTTERGWDGVVAAFPCLPPGSYDVLTMEGVKAATVWLTRGGEWRLAGRSYGERGRYFGPEDVTNDGT